MNIKPHCHALQHLAVYQIVTLFTNKKLVTGNQSLKTRPFNIPFLPTILPSRFACRPDLLMKNITANHTCFASLFCLPFAPNRTENIKISSTSVISAISRTYFDGSIQISVKTFHLPRISTKFQKMSTVGIA